MAGLCKIPDLEHMTIDDVADWHDYLVAKQEAEEEARRRADEKARKK